MMRHSILRSTALLVCAAVAAVFLAVPPASAQTTTPFAIEQTIVCGTTFFARISGGTAPYTVSYQAQGLTLAPFTVAAAGPFQSPNGYLSSAPYGTYMFSVTASDRNGLQASTSFGGMVSETCGGTASQSTATAATTAPISVPAGVAGMFTVPSPVAPAGAMEALVTPDQLFLAQAAAVPPAAAAAVPEPAPAEPAPASATPELAATGSKADLPMMIGSVLVAAGAAFVANDKRRRRWS